MRRVWCISVDENLMVCDTVSGTPVYTLDEAFSKLAGNAFPVFTPYNNADIAQPLAHYLKYGNRSDAAYMDSDVNAIRTAREIYPYLRGIYLAENGMSTSAIAEAALSATAQTAALPSALCTQETVAALQSTLLTVAAYPSETAETELMRAAASGANIVISPSASAARSAAAVLGSTTITRAPLLIGAAGSPGQAPENSLSSFSAAVNAGAGAIQADIRLTADGIPVVMKDETIDRTTTGSGRVDAMTLTAIKQFKLWGENNAFSASHPNETVPSLTELLQRFRSTRDADFARPAQQRTRAGTSGVRLHPAAGDDRQSHLHLYQSRYAHIAAHGSARAAMCIEAGRTRRNFYHQQCRKRAYQAARARTPCFRTALHQLRKRHGGIHRCG